VKPSKHHRRLRTPGDYYIEAEHPEGIDWPTMYARVRLVAAINRDREIMATLEAALSISAPQTDASRLNAMDEWQRSWRIADWMMELGILYYNWGDRTGELWAQRGEEDRIRAWRSVDTSPDDDVSKLGGLLTDDFDLHVPGCDLTQVHFADWAAWVRALVDEQLRAIGSSAKQSAKQQQMRKGVTRPAALQERYYDWTVQFQLCGKGLIKIAGAAGVTHSVVGEAVRAVAQRARIELRSRGTRGRPRTIRAQN
jgi:hypothetical protein